KCLVQISGGVCRWRDDMGDAPQERLHEFPMPFRVRGFKARRLVPSATRDTAIADLWRLHSAEGAGGVNHGDPRTNRKVIVDVKNRMICGNPLCKCPDEIGVIAKDLMYSDQRRLRRRQQAEQWPVFRCGKGG